MSYDYKKEYNLWKQWKDNEEKILRKHNVDEKIISDLRKFDMAQFNAERSLKDIKMLQKIFSSLLSRYMTK